MLDRSLGIHIDNKLDYSDHINYLGRKVACSVGILCKLKSSFPKEILLQLYHALVFPHLLYAIPVWGSTYKTKLCKILSLHNKTAKIISGAH